jgi:hypothetical protein
MKVAKYLGFDRPCANFKGLCGANPKYLTTVKHGGIFLRYRLSETVITYLPSMPQHLNVTKKGGKYGFNKCQRGFHHYDRGF